MKNKKEEVVEIDVVKLLRALLRDIWAIILAAVIFGGAFFSYTYFLIAPTYKASALLYVNNNNISLSGQDISISTSSLSAAQELVNTYIVILQARTTLTEVIDEAGLLREESEINGAKKVLSAAAMTYVAALAVTLANLLRYAILFLGRGRRR